MRVLLVEDDDYAAESLVAATAADPSLAFVRCVSKRAAQEALDRGQHFDLVVCDLAIPARDGGLDTSSAHGLAVGQEAARVLPGTPRYFLTGVAEENIDDLEDAVSRGVVSSALDQDAPIRMVRSFRKSRTAACAQEILDVAASLRTLNEGVAVESAVTLSQLERRAIAIAARQWNGETVLVRELGGGLSSGTTLHADVTDGRGHHRASIFLKIDDFSSTHEEYARYREFVQGRLDQAFPEFVSTIQHFLGRTACLVFKFADPWQDSLFSSLQKGTLAETTIEDLRSLMEPWTHISEPRTLVGRDLREASVRTDVFEAAMYAELGSEADSVLQLCRDFESRQVRCELQPQHGDLHGENVLVAPDRRPTLIDCADIGMAPSSHDPVTLELSLIFHPASPALGTGWPTALQMHNRLDMDAFVEDCPVGAFVRQCRAWADESSTEAQASLSAYLYLTRQLKYTDTPKALAIAGIRGIVDRS